MKEEKVTAKKETRLILIVIAFFLLSVSILILVMVSGAIKDIEIQENANFVEVEATIVEYKENIVYGYNNTFPIGTSYYTMYEYKSPNGGIYSGCWQARIKTEEEAKAQIGKKVTIYVDDELKLQTKTLKTDRTGVTIGAICGSLCLLISLSIYIYFIVKLVRWRKNKEYLIETDDKKNKETKPPKNFCTLHSVIMLFTLFMAISCVGSSVSKEKNYQKYINANFVEVVGEIYEYKEFKKDNSLYYATYYKYVSSDGQEFVDLWKNDIYSKKDAEAAIGSEVPLLYDKEYGVIKSMSDLEPVPKPDHTLNIILTVVFGVLFVNSLARFIRFIIRNERYKAEQKRQGITIE